MNPHSEPRKHGTDINSTENAPPASPTDPASASMNSTDSDSRSNSTNNDASANNAERKDHANLTENTAPTAPAGHSESAKNSEPTSQPFTAAHTAAAPPAETQVTLRGPAELADALPYLMGFYPDDSIVMVALHGERGRFGGRVRLGIPADTAQWPDVADQLADCLISAGPDDAAPPSAIIVYLCQEPAAGETGQDVKDRLRPLAQRLRTACGALDVPVLEALCLSNGRFWSYCCPDFRCCPADGTPMVMPGTSVMAAAAAYAGLQVRGSLKEMEARLRPRTGRRGADQEKALDTAAGALVPRMLGDDGALAVRRATLDLAGAMIHRFRQDTPSGSNRARDACDDALITDAEAADLILGLQDRCTRDRAAEWMDGSAAAPALRLWRALARRCAGGYAEHAVAPLTLAAWVSWSTDDGPSARIALSYALSMDPEYTFAQLLHCAINEGLDPEPLRRCLREQRREAMSEETGPALAAGPAPAAEPGAGAQPAHAGNETPRSPKRPDPARPGAAARPRGPRGATGPGGRTADRRARRRAGRDDDRSRR